MRGQILDAVFERMKVEDDIFFLNADMGINLVEKFGHFYPERYINVGIAEQNMISICAGLANLGYRPFAYTISNFLIHRCFEQIRNDISMHGYPITLLGTSTGYDNSPLGPTHHVVDEWGVLKSIPGIDIYCPSSITYAGALVERIIQNGRPAYIRIPKGTSVEPATDLGMVKLPGESDEIILVSYGNPVQTCIEVRRRNPRFSVLVVNKLHPLDNDSLLEALSPHGRIVVVEDHLPSSGLYGSLCEFAARHSLRGRLESVAPTGYAFEVGSTPDYFFQKFGMDVCSLLKLSEN